MEVSGSAVAVAGGVLHNIPPIIKGFPISYSPIAHRAVRAFRFLPYFDLDTVFFIDSFCTDDFFFIYEVDFWLNSLIFRIDYKRIRFLI